MRPKRRALFKIRETVPLLFVQSVLGEHVRSDCDHIERIAQIVPQNTQESIAILSLALMVIRNYLRDVLIDRFGEPSYFFGAACEAIGATLTPHPEHARAHRPILGHYLHQVES
jgi:hypothetical protein